MNFQRNLGLGSRLVLLYLNTNLGKNLMKNAVKALKNSSHEKSRPIQGRDYEIFDQLKLKNEIISTNGTVLLAYLQKLLHYFIFHYVYISFSYIFQFAKFSPGSLWMKCSILKSTLIVNKNMYIFHFS